MTVQPTHPNLLIAGAEAFGLSLSARQLQALQAYLSELITWNQRLNLTAIREPQLMVRRHLIDCISIVPFLQPSGRIIDVGSGPGLPGIPIKILCPDKIVTLLEPRRKRANFLRHVIRTLQLTDIQVLETRIQSLRPDDIPMPDETITRAFIDNEDFLRASGMLLRFHGACILMHGPKGLNFLEKVSKRLPSMGLAALAPRQFLLPFGDEERTVLFFERVTSVSAGSAQPKPSSSRDVSRET